MPVHFSLPQLQDHLPLSGAQDTRCWVFSHLTLLTGLLHIVNDLNKLRFLTKLNVVNHKHTSSVQSSHGVLFLMGEGVPTSISFCIFKSHLK